LSTSSPENWKAPRRLRIDAGIRDAPGKDRDDAWSTGIQGFNDARHLVKSKNRRNVERNPFRRKSSDHLSAEDTFGIGNGYLYVNITAPSSDYPRLRFHFIEFIGKNF